jgi:outer membrane immunogenic protein
MKSRGYLLATASSVAAAAAAAGGAQAADLGVRKAPPPAPVVAPPSWTGWYVGVHAGANWQMADAEYAAPFHTGSIGASLPGGNTVGFIGGGQIGYNWQFAPTWVLGVEATISGLTGKATAKPEFTLTKGNGFSSEINWLATVRGRIGWLMDPDTMFYGTGGVAWGGVKNSANPNGFNNVFCCTKSESTTRTGWVAGGGIEHMLGGAWSHWTLGVEVLYVDLGSSTGTGVAADGDTKGTKFHNKAAIGQVKLNYKF